MSLPAALLALDVHAVELLLFCLQKGVSLLLKTDMSWMQLVHPDTSNRASYVSRQSLHRTCTDNTAEALEASYSCCVGLIIY